MLRIRVDLAPLAFLLLLSSCAHRSDLPSRANSPRARGPLDWLLGEWEGVRRDVADGSEAPLSMRVSAILGGRGQCEELSIAGEDGPYLGYAVRVPIDENGHWLQHYWNTARPEPAALDGVVEGSMVTFQTHDTSRARRTRAVLEPVAPDRLRRTMFLTEDGGEHWRVFWVDEARRR